jgi:glycosyltransferase involved in cell wall biosynthesis
MLLGIDASRAVTTRRTGTEAYAYSLIRALIVQAAAEDTHLRLYFNQAPPPDLFPDAPHVELCTIPFPRLWTHIRLAHELRRRPPDVFFTPAHVIPFLYRGPSVATIHDLGYYYFPEAHTRRQVAYLKLSTYTNARLGRRVIVDSQTTKADLLRFYQTDPEKIDVIYPGLDSSLAQVTDDDELARIWRKYGITPPYFIYIGTLQPRKNLSRLVRAFVAADLPHRLVLAGKPGWRAQPLLDEIAELDFETRRKIHLPGYVDEADKGALLSGAEALLYPSLHEGFGFPLLEGQICGTPVLAANSSSLPEIAGDSTLLVDPLDVAAITSGIKRLAGEPALREELVAKGRLNVQRFSWDDAATAVLDTLRRAASA